MPKAGLISVRVSLALRKELEKIAFHEARTLSQVCQALLEGGVDAYKKEGTPYLHRYLARERERK